jgi:hypothetical protein
MKQTSELFDFVSIIRKRKKDALFVCVGILLGILLDWTIIEVAIFAIFLWSLLGPIQSRFLAVPALFFLTVTPILLILGRETRAEEFAVYAYYFLAMTVIRGIIEIRQDDAHSA